MQPLPPVTPSASPAEPEQRPAGPSPSVQGDFVAGDKRVTQIAQGDIVGRDKIINNIQNIVQRALSAGEEAEQARSRETLILAQGVRALAERLQARAGQGSDHPRPYKGLAEYRLGDADVFCGRGRATRELFQNLANGPLTVLHAEAGLGKTSLLQAGLTPRLLAAGHLPLDLRPYNLDPALAIKRALIADLSQTPLLAAAPLRDFLLNVCAVLGPATPLTICLDQFEEFFSQLDDAARAGFVRALAECLDDASLAVRWVLALRTEYFGQLATFRPSVRNPFENDYALGRLTRAEALEVMAGTAVAPGPPYEPGLAGQLLDDLGGAEIAPAQLQLVCSTLYAAREPGAPSVTRALYERAGGLAGILRGYLDNVLAHNLPPGDRDPAWQALAGVAAAGAKPAGEQAVLAQLAAYGVSEVQARRVLAFLETSQLLRLTDEHYELASDSLLPRIRAWADERSVVEQARAEANRQVRRIRSSALRGLVAGALGFGLAYWVAYVTQSKLTLIHLTLQRTMPGALAGLLFVLSSDLALAVYRGPRRGARWPVGGLAGAASFALALAYHALLRSALYGLPQIALIIGQGLLEGAAWGLVTGLGLVWVFGSPWPRWQTVPLVVAASTLIFVLSEQALHLFEQAPLWALLAAGAVWPLCLLAAGLMAPDQEAE